MSRSREVYDIRTNAYYIGQGGIYAEVLSILTNMRQLPKFRGLPMPAKLLNQACFVYDSLEDVSIDDYENHIQQIDDILCLCIVASLSGALSDTGLLLTHTIMPYIEEDKIYYPYFEKLLQKWENYHIQIVEERHSYLNSQQITDLEDEVNVLKGQLDEANEKISKFRQVINELKITTQSKSDKALTFDNILDYISQHKQYQFVAPIINMLKDITHSVITEDQYQRLVEVEKKILEESVIVELHNHNQISDSNVFPGNVTNPSFPINK